MHYKYPHQRKFTKHPIIFFSGAKIHQSASSARFIEQGGHTYSVDEGMDIPETMVPFYEHAQEGLRRCKSIEEALTTLQKQGNGGDFPATIGRKRRLGESSHSNTTTSDSGTRHSQSSLTDSCQTSPSQLQFSNSDKVFKQLIHS